MDASSATSSHAPPALVACDGGGKQPSAHPQLLWRFNAVGHSHVASDMEFNCLSHKAKRNETCNRCLDANANDILGVWDCKDEMSSQESNQWFHWTNNGVGIRANRSNLCLTASPGGGGGGSSGIVELHDYDDGLSFVSNTDTMEWLRVAPWSIGGGDWEITLAPSSVVLVNRSISPPLVLFDTASFNHGGGDSIAKTKEASIITAEPTAEPTVEPTAELTASLTDWEYYQEKPGAFVALFSFCCCYPLSILHLISFSPSFFTV